MGLVTEGRGNTFEYRSIDIWSEEDAKVFFLNKWTDSSYLWNKIKQSDI